MEKWIESIYSDGTKVFVSDPTPNIGDVIKIRIRFFEDAPVKHVLVRSVPNGAERYDEAKLIKSENGLAYYEADFVVTEYHMNYHFILACEDVIYYYTQNGVTTYIPDHTYDFWILTDYRQPDWVDKAVFYQIFPERFANGDPELNVKEGEYEYHGSSPIVMKDWNEKQVPPETGRGMDFYGGDLPGIISKIPYLKELGVNAIYLNPIFEAYSTHKYDCIDYFHVDRHFGGDEALERLSKELHANDMKLILDISINHTGIEHEWVKEGRDFYFKNPDGSLKGWSGVDSLPVLDYRNEELRDLIYRGKDAVLRKWLREPYSIDGWRFDVADVFARNDDVQLSDEIWPEVCRAIREENPDAIIIGEDWGDCGKYLHGDLWNTPMNYFGFGRIIRQFEGLPDLFEERIECLNNVKYDMQAEDVVGRTNEHYAKIPQVIADCQMNLFDSHDIARMHNYDLITFEKWKSAVISQFFWTGIPCVYYGDELAVEGYTWHDSGFRYTMPWDRKTENREKHFETYKKLISLRKNVGAFSRSRKVLYAKGKILAIARFDEKDVYVGVISLDENQQTFGLPLDLVGASLPAEKEDVFGNGLDFKGNGGEFMITMQPFGSTVFKCR